MNKTTSELIKGYLPEKKSKFPVGEGLTVIGGRTLYKGQGWFKAILMVETSYGSSTKKQIRLYGWQKNDEGKWKQRQKFNISPAKYLGDIISILRRFGGEKGSIDLERELANRISEIRKLEKEIKNLQERKFEEIESNRKSRIPELKSKMEKFNDLLDSNETEKVIQDFLKDNIWFFGPEYYEIDKEVDAGIKGRNDFLLKRKEGYHDIVELKKPSHNLFLDSTEWKMSSKVRDALSQMARYLEYYNTHYLSFKDQTGRDVLNPRGIIVIGRNRRDDTQKLLKTHDRLFSKNIEIKTYDDIVDLADRTIETYEND